MARSGQIRGRVSDEQLLSLLDQVAQAEQRGSSSGGSAKSKITVSGKRDHSHAVRTGTSVGAQSLTCYRPISLPIWQVQRRHDKLDSDDDDDDEEFMKSSSAAARSRSDNKKTATAEEDDDDIFDL